MFVNVNRIYHLNHFTHDKYKSLNFSTFNEWFIQLIREGQKKSDEQNRDQKMSFYSKIWYGVTIDDDNVDHWLVIG